MILDIVFNSVTGERLENLQFRSVAQTPLTAKLQPGVPVRVRFADQVTGALVAANGPIKIGFKPKGHYSDAVFDGYSNAFAAAGTTGDDLLTYTSTLFLDGDPLKALFVPNADGVSVDSVDLMGEVKVGDVPTATFTLTVLNNVIKGAETPPNPGQGVPLYPRTASSNAAKQTLVNLAVGTHVAISGEGNRLEQFLPVNNGGPGDDRNWVVLRNTVQLVVNFAALDAGPTYINGVALIAGVSVDVGWVDPVAIPFTVGSFSVISGLSVIVAAADGDGAGSSSLLPAYPSGQSLYAGSGTFCPGCVAHPRGQMYLSASNLIEEG